MTASMLVFVFIFTNLSGNSKSRFLSHVRSEDSLSYVHIEDRWFRPGLRDDQICFFARDIQAGETVTDVAGISLPLTIYRLFSMNVAMITLSSFSKDTDGWAVVHMYMIDECPSICLFGAPRQHGFSCGGGSVEPGDEMVFPRPPDV